MKGRGLMIVLAVGLALVRLIHLGADTPPELSSSDGLYVDEGYKTLSPRNLVSFGTTHWHPKDSYTGWMTTSPVTNWSYYAAFRVFGANIEAARSVTILFFALLLIGFAVAMSGRYSLGLIVAGLLLLGFESTLFFLSRIALFEIPVVTILYGLLFIFARMKPHKVLTPVLLALGTSLFLVLGIKFSALLYLAPVLLAVATFLVLEKGSHQPSARRRYVFVIAVGICALLALTYEAWMSRLEIGPLEIGRQILDNPLVHRSPVPLLAGILCAVHGLVCRPDLFLRNIYRLSLVAMVLLGIPFIAIFAYDPMRYYAPLLPAYLLIVLEWYHLRGWRFPAPRASFAAGLVTVAVMTAWLYYLIGFLLMGGPVLFSGRDVSLLEITLVLLLAVGVWTLRSFTLRGTVVAATLLLLLPLFVVSSTRQVGSFLLQPSFQARQIRSDLMQLLPEGSIVAGVWAPFLLLGTPYRALYLAEIANPAVRIPELAPDYILLARPNRNSDITIRQIRRTHGIRLQNRVYTAEYNEKAVALYPLRFGLNSLASVRRGPFFTGRSLARDEEHVAAEPLLRASLNDLQQVPEIDPALIAELRGELGVCLAQLGRHAEAEEPLLQAYQTFRPAGEAPAEVLARTTLRRLMVLYQGLNRPDEATKYRLLHGPPARMYHER